MPAMTLAAQPPLLCCVLQLCLLASCSSDQDRALLLNKLKVNVSIDELVELIRLSKHLNLSEYVATNRSTETPAKQAGSIGGAEINKLPNESCLAANDSIMRLWMSQSWFSESYLDIINTHWLRFPPQPKSAHYFLAALYVLIMLMGIFGNCLVIYMFIRCRSLRSPANILITNLAISDLAMMCSMPLFVYNSVHRGLAMGEMGCRVYGFLGGLTGTVSIVTLAAISLDRYYVVVYPLNRSSTRLRSKVCVVVAWVYGATFAALPLLDLDTGDYVPEGYLTSCSFDYLHTDSRVKHFILTYFVAAWLAPFLLISFCYFNIIRVVVKARNIGNSLKDPSGSGRHCKDEEKKRTEMRLALIVLAIIGLWFLAWTPYAAIALLGIAGQHHLITPSSSIVPALFCKTASCLDPFVYAVTHNKFRDELKSLFWRRRSGAVQPGTSKKAWSTNASRQVTVRRGTSVDEAVEEERIEVEFAQGTCSAASPTAAANTTPRAGGAVVAPSEHGADLSRAGRSARASWILKPTFSNRSSSIRSLARTWNRSRDRSSTDDEQCT